MSWEKKLEPWAIAVASLALALAGLFAGNNPDTFGHLAQGRQIALLGRVPSVDSWSLLPGPPRVWHNYEWLSDLLYYGLYASFGYDALIALKCTLLAVTAWLLLRVAAQLAGSRAVLFGSLALIACIPAIRIRLSDRPHVLGLCLAALYLLALVRIVSAEHESNPQRTRTRLLLALAAAHVVWVNLHGSHLLGVAMTGLFLLAGGPSPRRALATLLGLELLASCVSPYGPAIVLDAIGHIADPRYRNLVSEWRPWDEHDPVWLQLGPLLHVALLAIGAPRLWRTGASGRAPLLIAALLAVASFRSIRFIAELMLLSSPLIGAGLAKLTSQASTRAVITGWSLGLSCLLGVVPAASAKLPPGLPIGHGSLAKGLPEASGAWLHQHAPKAHVFAMLQDAWYLMFAAPDARFFVDGRVPFYGPEHVSRASQAFGDRGLFESIVASSRIDAVAVNHAMAAQRELLRWMRDDSGWSLVVIEDQHALFVRDALSTEAQRLRALVPSYDPRWVLEASPSEVSAMHTELAALADSRATRGYTGWVKGLLTLAPLKRPGTANGFRWPQSADEVARYRAALRLFLPTAEVASDVPVVGAVIASVAAALCEPERARAALEQATRETLSREAVLATQELALREGSLDEVRAFVAAARAQPQAQGDPWLAELEAGLSSPPACPPH